MLRLGQLARRYLSGWAAWRSARRLTRRIPAHRELDRAILAARKAHRSVAPLIKRKQALVIERLQHEAGAR